MLFPNYSKVQTDVQCIVSKAVFEHFQKYEKVHALNNGHFRIKLHYLNSSLLYQNYNHSLSRDLRLCFTIFLCSLTFLSIDSCPDLNPNSSTN